jgi:hypothetical protein
MILLKINPLLYLGSYSNYYRDTEPAHLFNMNRPPP